MKIGIDISQVVYGTGVSVYTKELVRKLLEIDHEDEFVLFGGSLRNQYILRQFCLSLKGNLEFKILPFSPTMADFVWNRVHRLKVEKLIGKVDVFHSSDWTQPPTNAFKVTTVHDLAPLKFPKATPPRIVSVHSRRLYWVLRECDRIIVPSKSIKGDLIATGGKEEKIFVIPEAAGEIFRPQPQQLIKSVKVKYGIKDDYLITVGYGERKNTEKLIEAYEKVKRKNLKLVVVGGLRKESETRGVIFTGYVTDLELAALYSGAKALAYPSFYEGFGLPVLQAFSCGCPVVTSKGAAMEEVADKAAILIDPYKVSSIAEGIDEILRKPKEYIKKGLKRVEEFSWEKAARDTLQVYRESLSKI